MEIPAFTYFMNQYRDLLQMSLTGNIEFFSQSEPELIKKALLKEVEMIEENLKLEDWEMDKTVALLCKKYSKRWIKKIVETIRRELIV
jgi:hypothetical protein